MTLGIDQVATAPTTAPVTLLYVSAGGQVGAELEVRLGEIVGRYQPFVELRTFRPDEVEALTGEKPLVPRLLVLRGGEVVGQAMGALLPTRELDRVVRCAVEWI
ncbi:MAG: hypothetical protein KJO07_23060 [Deltaproteobacteria bacterium]|jgi:hypothetical protein|nr:hypothetical protein [Deltaproteobacteria bacterium]